MLSDTAASPRSWEQTSRENKAYATYDDEDAYVVMGTHGSLSIPTMRLRTYARDEDRSWFKPFQSSVVPLQRADPLALQIAHFAEVIRGRGAAAGERPRRAHEPARGRRHRARREDGTVESYD